MKTHFYFEIRYIWWRIFYFFFFKSVRFIICFKENGEEEEEEEKKLKKKMLWERWERNFVFKGDKRKKGMHLTKVKSRSTGERGNIVRAGKPISFPPPQADHCAHLEDRMREERLENFQGDGLHSW